jgi:hypothetical protein
VIFSIIVALGGVLGLAVILLRLRSRTYQNRQNMAIGLVLSGVVLVAGVVMTINSLRLDPRPRVIFVNESECGGIPVTLTNDQTGEVQRATVEDGQRLEFPVEPDVPYRYNVDFSAAPRQDGNWKCTDIQQGTVRVPAGTSQTFTLASERVAPPPLRPITATPPNVVP